MREKAACTVQLCFLPLRALGCVDLLDQPGPADKKESNLCESRLCQASTRHNQLVARFFDGARSGASALLVHLSVVCALVPFQVRYTVV